MSDAEEFFNQIEERRQEARDRAKAEQERIGSRATVARGSTSQALVVRMLEEEHGLVLSTRALSQIENGIRPIRLSEAVALAEVYGVELTAFTQDHMTRSAEGVARIRANELGRIRDWIDGRIEELSDELGEG